MGSSSTDDAASRSYFAARRRRRLRIAALLVLIGAMTASSSQIDPLARPIVFASLWLAVTLSAGWLLWLGLLDYFSARRYWSDQTSRNLADIAQARAELHAHQSPERNGRH